RVSDNGAPRPRGHPGNPRYRYGFSAASRRCPPAQPMAAAMVGPVELREALADPRARLGVGLAALLATAGAVHRDRRGACEVRTFQAVNGLPDALYPPAWIVMQLGAFGAVPASAFTAWRAGDGELAARLLLGGTGAWALSKLVKQVVRRPRPVALLPGIHGRGREAAGLRDPSGHPAAARARGRPRRPGRRPLARAGPGGPRPPPARHAPGGADPHLRGRPSPARHRGRGCAGTGR